MSPAIELAVEMMLTGRIRHGGNAVLTAAVMGAILIGDAAGNQKLDKERSNRRGPVRIDPATGMIMALDLARRQVGPPPDPGKELNDAIIARGGFA
jgi:phage terminase large subunit-like protein